MKPVDYDPVVLRAQAAVLYDRAGRLVFWATVQWAIYGAALGALIAAAPTVRAVDDQLYANGIQNPGGSAFVLVIILGVIAGFIGRSGAHAKAWALRLEAQTALCQVQIEENTRPKV
jgi:hypothetical protein